MTKLALRFLKDDAGATAIEYGLIAAGISVAIIAVVQGLGTELITPRSARFRAPSNNFVLARTYLQPRASAGALRRRSSPLPFNPTGSMCALLPSSNRRGHVIGEELPVLIRVHPRRLEAHAL